MLASSRSESLLDTLLRGFPHNLLSTTTTEQREAVSASTGPGVLRGNGVKVQSILAMQQPTSADPEWPMSVIPDWRAVQSARYAPTGVPDAMTFLDLLAILAEEGDPAEFVHLVSQLDRANWRENDHARMIRLALWAGAHRLAASLSEQARERYPHHSDIRRLSDLLAPVPDAGKRLPAKSAIKANREWFIQHAAQYRGQWAAVRDGQLLASASTLHELKNKIGDSRSATISKVV